MKIKRNFVAYCVLTYATLSAVVSCKINETRSLDVSLKDTFRNAVQVADADSSIARITYGDFFQDPTLVSLIDKAIEKNNDLQIAIRQVDFAAQGLKQAKWLYAPIVNANLANVAFNRPSNNSINGLMASQFFGQSYTMDYRSDVTLSWEADIWGKIKAQNRDAVMETLKTEEAAKSVKIRIVHEVVQGYYNLLMLDKQLEITKRNLVFSDSTLVILRKQLELGMINSLAVQQQEMQKDQIAVSIPEIESSIAVQENALSVLTGSMPARVEREKGLDYVAMPSQLSSGVPTELLSYRPDIKSAELDIRQQQLAIHVAKVSMYPALNITAQGGLNALTADNWFSVPGSLFGLAAGAIAQPILQGRQLKTRYEQAKISALQSEYKFKQSLLTAVSEVSDALVQIDKIEEQQMVTEKMTMRADAIVVNSLKLYQFNDASYLDVLLAQTNKLQAELDLASIKARKLTAISVLYRSLGGGWL